MAIDSTASGGATLLSVGDGWVDRLPFTAAIGTITVVVSHRLSTVRMADLIVIVDQGRIPDAGSHEELMQRHRLYMAVPPVLVP